MQFRRLALILFTVAAVAGLSLSGASDAEAGKATIKFWAKDYKVEYTPAYMSGEELVAATVVLEVTGRASAYGGDKVDFEWTDPNGARWLPLLQVCGGGQGRLTGTISSQVDQSDRGIEGKGPIDELNCRVILK